MREKFYLSVITVCVIAIIVIGYVCWFSPVTTVILVRHADRSNDHLSDIGLRRADTLAYVIGETKVDAIYVTEYQRTQQTGAPTAAAFGVTAIEHPAADTEGLVNRIISDHGGEVVLIVGHSNTVPEIIEALGASPASEIGHDDYDNLFVVHLSSFNRATLTHLKFGSHLN